MSDSQEEALAEWRRQIVEPVGEVSLGDVPVEIDGRPYVFKNVRMLPPVIGELDAEEADVNTFTVALDAFQEGT